MQGPMVAAFRTQMQSNNRVGRRLYAGEKSIRQRPISDILNSNPLASQQHLRFQNNVHRFIIDDCQMKMIIIDMIYVLALKFTQMLGLQQVEARQSRSLAYIDCLVGLDFPC